ncbi:MAG: type II toxin-antitoxin system VapC family toxin [Betaproteobacteria bacterium]
MRYLLDTCTVSDFVRGHPNVLQVMTQKDPAVLSVSAITRMEIDFGLALNPARAAKLVPLLDDFFSVVSTLGFELSDAEAAASVRASLQKRGRPVGAYDVLIAGTALARGLTVVTSNLSEFNRISGLRVENWR